MPLFLRLFAECASAAQSVQQQEQLLRGLAPWQPQPESQPARYWKIPELFEYTFGLSPSSVQTLRNIQSLAPTGWTETESDGEYSLVWNRSNGNHFLIAELTWAELLLHHEMASHLAC